MYEHNALVYLSPNGTFRKPNNIFINTPPSTLKKGGRDLPLQNTVHLFAFSSGTSLQKRQIYFRPSPGHPNLVGQMIPLWHRDHAEFFHTSSSVSSALDRSKKASARSWPRSAWHMPTESHRLTGLEM